MYQRNVIPFFSLKEIPWFSPKESLVSLSKEKAKYQPAKTAYTFLGGGEIEECSLTYEQLDKKAIELGTLLCDLGLQGERVLLMYSAGLDFVVAFLGCLYAGVIAVPVYPPRRNQSLERLQAIIKDCQAKEVLSTSAIKSNLEKSLVNYPQLTKLNWLTTDNLPKQLNQHRELPKIRPRDLAFLQYTSGSTGTPKGVMVSHENLLHNQKMLQAAFKNTQNTSYVSWLPLFHDMGLIGNILQSLYLGSTCILISPVDFLQKPYRWLKAISQYGARVSGGPNFAYDLCVNKITPEQIETLDLSSWEVAFNGAEPVRAETIEQFSAKFAACGFRKQAFYPCYGMAEATLFITGGLSSQLPVLKTINEKALEENRVVEVVAEQIETRTLVSCGREWLGQKVIIVDPKTLIKCNDNQVGEIWVSGESVAKGYWQQDQKTQETFKAYVADTQEGPFLRTGDLGFLSEDGELFVTGRLKDVIIVRGRNHYPQDIELTVEQSHPALRATCGATFTVGTTGNERLVIVQEVERTHLRKIDINEVQRCIRQAVARDHGLQVHDVVLLKTATITKTSSGKIQRSRCKEKFLSNMLDCLQPVNAARVSLERIA